LIEKEGYVYVDVRSVPEFEQGHPTGAYNVPLLNMGASGMTPNADFITVMEKSFPKDAKLVVGCKGGGRSLRAASLLLAAGFQDVVDQRGGFDGSPADPGWRPAGLPVSVDAPTDHRYEALRSR
jgi:rhodanese-related sulfurtransferase